MRKYIQLLVLSFILLQWYSASAQSKLKTQLRMAEKEYKDLRYVAAIKYLDMVMEEDSTNVKAIEMMAYSNRNLRKYKESLRWFEKLSKQDDPKPVWALHYAEALSNNQKYELAENWYRKYLKMVPADKRAKAFVKSGIFSNQDNAEWKVEKTKLSSSADEYAPMFYKEGLLFCSNRLESKLVNPVFGWNQKPYSDLYFTDDLSALRTEGGKAGAAAKASARIKVNDDDTAPTSNDSRTLVDFDHEWLQNLAEDADPGLKIQAVKGKVNSIFNEGPGAMLPEGAFIFTRNNFKGLVPGKSKNGVVKLKMYIAKAPNWNKIEEFSYNNDNYSVGHPAVSKDGKVLVFASDMPGGQGGVDLYYSVRTGAGKKWTRPVNMGTRINTEGDEMFPHFLSDNTLLFSSTGYAGFGGLDIFEVALKDYLPVSAPKNLGAPINSFGDDFGMIRTADGKSGYFSSNRDGSDDIYYYTRQKFHVYLKGTIADGNTKVPPIGAQVYLRYANGIDTLRVNRRGEFAKELNKETDYEIIGSSPGFITKRAFLTTTNIFEDSTITVNLKLDKSEKAQLWVSKNCDSLKRVFSIKNIYYDLDRSVVREDAKPTLNTLAELMMNHKEISVITSSHCDTRASAEYNKALSLRRGEAAKSYLISRGIPASRIKVEYFGKSRLVNRCTDEVPCSEEDQQLNRRTEFDVILHGVNLTQMDCAGNK
ncbi:OmpA family protein [Desertivirga arenae]|uniref:OmpA family protein n=1 Tax=Desertivirga arenae TaxID=2810309 RepID=UPI00350EFA8B